MRLIIITLLFFVCTLSNAQNLIPNPSFEDTLGCPTSWDGIEDGYAAHWFKPTWGSSDLFTSCHLVPQSWNGYQFAHSGNAYAGIIAYCQESASCTPDNINREYLSVRLLESLEVGVKYYVKFSASRADSALYASNIGVLLSDSVHQESTMNLPNIPQFETSTPLVDRVNWTDYNFSFFATGIEDFITIGNFSDNDNSDITFIEGGGNPLLRNHQHAYYYIDDVCVSTDSLFCRDFVTGLKHSVQNSQKINIYPSPTYGPFSINSEEPIHGVLTIRNSFGQMVKSEALNGKVHHSQLDGPSGIYFLRIETENQILNHRIIKH